MNLEEIRAQIEIRSGVPISLLTGETTEEVIAQAKAFISLKREYKQKAAKDARTDFAEWASSEMGEENISPEDESTRAILDLEEELRLNAGGYPQIENDGNNINLGEGLNARQQFDAFMSDSMAFNPFKNSDTWGTL